MPTTSRRCKSKLSLLLTSVTLVISATVTAANPSDKTISLDPESVHRATQAESKLKLIGEHNPRTSSSLEPSYLRTAHYTTTVSTDGDPADIYYPVVPKSAREKFPIALLLQGALVDKADYANFATQVARYGFIVAVPNNERTITAPNRPPVTGLFSEQQQVNDVLKQMAIEDKNPASPIVGIVDTNRLGLLGHSFGGAVGLGASQNDICLPGICSNYAKPPELIAGIFYGTSFRDQTTNNFLPVKNQGVSLGLIQGDRDGVIQPRSTKDTYTQIRNPPKVLITVEGANHYGVTNQDNPKREPNRPTLDQATSIETISRWSALFLQAHLNGHKQALKYIYQTGDGLDPNVSVISKTEHVLP